MCFVKLCKSLILAVWNLFDPFTGYGFNKAHAYSYAMVSYHTAYMKANYTADYMAAALTSEAENYDRSVLFFGECKKLNIPILKPDVNKSFYTYEVEEENGDSIRIGLKSIKNLGTKTALSIVEEREKNGNFDNLKDFLQRMSFYKVINKKSLEALICSGSLDKFSTRATFMKNIGLLLEYEKEFKQTQTSAQETLFSESSALGELVLIDKGMKDSESQNQFWEKDLLGVYISGHPIAKHNKNIDFQIEDIKKKSRVGDYVSVNVVITKIKKVKNKKGGMMIFFSVEDEFETIEVACFDADKLIDLYEELIVVNKCVNITAKMNRRDNEPTLIIEYDDASNNQIKELKSV